VPIIFKIPEDLLKQVKKKGVLDSDQVYVQYLCQTGEDGEHDPDEEPDDRVRPSHAAFHGQIFKIEDAPIPPLDYGCRCAIRYVAAPDSVAAEVLEHEADADPTTPVEATEEWLDKNVEDWEKLQDLAEQLPPKDAIAKVTEAAKKKGIEQPRQIAEMIVDVSNKGGDTSPVAIKTAIKTRIK
jgi:hypothetical protein